MCWDFYFLSYRKNLNIIHYSHGCIYLTRASTYLKTSFPFFFGPKLLSNCKVPTFLCKEDSMGLRRQSQYTSLLSSSTEINQKVQPSTGAMLQVDNQTAVLIKLLLFTQNILLHHHYSANKEITINSL